MKRWVWLLILMLPLLRLDAWAAYETITKQEDTANTGGKFAVPILCTRQDTLASSTDADGDYSDVKCDTAGNVDVTLGTLFSGEDQTNNLLMTSGGAVRKTTLASGVTTNTTSSAVAVFTGTKTIYGQVVCSSGACTQTQEFFCDIDNDAANGTSLGLLTLSGTTRDQGYFTYTAACSYVYVITTVTTGTSATGAMYAMQ